MSLLTIRTRHRPAARPAVSLAGLLATLSREFTLWQARRALNRLDDDALRDLGLPRGDIEAAVRHGRRGLRR